eukprot:14466971-Alexandrium_andersonii.AAC.1
MGAPMWLLGYEDGEIRRPGGRPRWHLPRPTPQWLASRRVAAGLGQHPPRASANAVSALAVLGPGQVGDQRLLTPWTNEERAAGITAV